MRIPFSPNLSLGTDIIAFQRLLKPHASPTHLQRLAARFLHPNELGELDKRFPEWQDFHKVSSVQQRKIGAHLAGRWAAKEAAKKAWGATLISFKDLRTETLPTGEVQIICQSYHYSPHASNLAPDDLHVNAGLEQAAKLSISHDGNYAVATVLATPLHPKIVATLQARKAEAEDQRFIDPTRFQHDPRHTAVDVYTKSHLLTPDHIPLYGALEHAYHNSLANGCPDISTTAAHGKFLAMQAKMSGAKNILEVGTLGGYSAIWLAGASKDMKITTIEVNPKWKELAETHFKEAGVEDQVKVLLGAAKDVLVDLQEEIKVGERAPFDFVFIDADKDNNLLYFKLVLDLVKPQTPIFVDNVVRHGDLADEEAAKKDSRVQGARNLVEHVGTENRVEAVVMQTVSEKDYDGFMMAITK